MESKFEGINITDKDGDTLLHFAVREGKKEVVEWLISKGADVNARGIMGFMPLHLAATLNHRDIMDLLIKKGADINAEDNNGKTPLYYAAMGELKEFFIKHGAKE